MNRKQRSAEIQESIRGILFDDWDPIGVNDLAPRDEYDSYIGGIYRLLASGANQEEVAAHLRKLEIEYMEVIDSDRRNSVAESLLALNISLENQI